ncbi:MAG: cysteine dioxygenase family protein [Planctomycetaceae bacterium]|nr:cysteine dioxygenase family protein [Planctomycetaceae bacterium]MBV8309152.1 cysteine dioxygenase family protein [Planctomycetaceae bacterium]
MNQDCRQGAGFTLIELLANGPSSGAPTFSCPEPAGPRTNESGRSLPGGRPGLIELLTVWDSLAGPIPEDVIRSGLGQLSLDRDALRGCAHFNERTYQRTLIHHTANYEILVLCWRSGQRSPIHDHGESACGVLVVEGVATETSFLVDRAGKMIVSPSRRIPAGSIFVSRGSDIHRVANLEIPGADLISLHVYSPRLAASRYFRIDQRQLVHEAHMSIPFPETILAPL